MCAPQMGGEPEAFEGTFRGRLGTWRRAGVTPKAPKHFPNAGRGIKAMTLCAWSRFVDRFPDNAWLDLGNDLELERLVNIVREVR